MDSTNEMAYLDGPCLERSLRARQNDAPKAVVMLRNTLTWRSQFGVQHLRMKEFPEEMKSGVFYVAGFDAGQRPIMVCRKNAERYFKDDADKYLRFLVLTLEAAIAMMPQGVEQMVWVLDARGLRSSDSPPIKVTQKLLNICADHYPERLRAVYVVDAPKVFWYLWKTINPFLDRSTKSKIHFVWAKDFDAGDAHRDEPISLEEAAAASEYADKALEDAAALEKEFASYKLAFEAAYEEDKYRSLLGKCAPAWC
eukprot:jgi/Mesvir1/26343/Mv22517-RA.1